MKRLARFLNSDPMWFWVPAGLGCAIGPMIGRLFI